MQTGPNLWGMCDNTDHAGRCRPWLITAKTIVSNRPITLNAHAVTPVICASSGTALMCRKPAVKSRRNEPREAGSGPDSATRMQAGATIAAPKVPASSRARQAAQRHAGGARHCSPSSAAQGRGEVYEPVGFEQAVQGGRVRRVRVGTPLQRPADEDRAQAQCRGGTQV